MHLPRIRSSSVALHQSEHLDKLTAINAFGCDLARLSLEASRSPEGAGTIIGGVMKILMALTSHDRLGTPARRPASGWRSSPLPIMSFGMPVPISPWLRPRAGSRRSIPEARNPLPGRRRRTASSRTKAAQALLADTARLSAVAADDYDAVFYPGGHGPLWDLAEDRESVRLIEAMHVARPDRCRGVPRARRLQPYESSGRFPFGQRQVGDPVSPIRRRRPSD